MSRYDYIINRMIRRIEALEARIAISEPSRPKFGSHHVGKKTITVLTQEGFSLQNSYKPQTMTESEKQEWQSAYDNWKEEISVYQDSTIEKMKRKIDEMLNK